MQVQVRKIRHPLFPRRSSGERSGAPRALRSTDLTIAEEMQPVKYDIIDRLSNSRCGADNPPLFRRRRFNDNSLGCNK
jgi:hypothetical protein